MSVLPLTSTVEFSISAFPVAGRIYAAYNLIDTPYITVVEIIDKEISIEVNYNVSQIGYGHIRKLDPTISYERLVQEIESFILEKHL